MAYGEWRVRIARLTLALAAGLAGQGAAAGDEASGPGFGPVAGESAGTVSEMGMARYELLLTLAGDGAGQASIPIPVPQRAGAVASAGLALRETVTAGREFCADGTVELSQVGERLRWTWRDAAGQVGAVGSLARAE